MSRQITASATINKMEELNSPMSSPKANSAIPLAPGVGLINMKIQSTNCLPKIKMWLKKEMGKNAAKTQLMTK